MRSASQKNHKNILLAVSGMSPQIITETLYALVTAKKWIPDEIHLVTTETGKSQAILQLLEGQRHFSKFLKDYRIKQPILFNESTIHIICDAKGLPMQDMKTPEDNEAAADCITDKIRELTANPDNELHVSLAGGRKTMGFYAGYALSLFGRPQDRLSHVLISSEYESLRDFFYPTPKTHPIYSHDGKKSLDAHKAKVWLAEIPFIRMRGGLPKNLLEGNKSFSETIQLARKATEKPTLLIEAKKQNITINNETVKLSPLYTLLLLWSAWRIKNNKGVITTLVDGERNDQYAQELVHLAEHYWINVPEKTLSTLKKDGVTKSFLETNKSRLAKSLDDKLGKDLASLCKLTIVKNGKTSGYALPDNLEISIR